MSENKGEQLHAIVHGRVQGVGFRDATERRAVELGLTGWVRNLADRTVEVVAEGDQAILETFLAYLQRGPNSAQVKQVDADWRAASGDFEHFGVR